MIRNSSESLYFAPPFFGSFNYSPRSSFDSTFKPKPIVQNTTNGAVTGTANNNNTNNSGSRAAAMECLAHVTQTPAYLYEAAATMRAAAAVGYYSKGSSFISDD